MPVFFSRKLSLFLLLCSLCAAVLSILALNHFLAGPQLGRRYDILLGFRPSVPAAREILLIETDEIIEPGDIFLVLLTLSQMGGSDLLIEAPVLGTGLGGSENTADFLYRINDEFALAGRNIRNLFEAIRMGLVHPAHSADYVERLVELTERGRDRLNASVIRQDEAGSVLAAQAARIFGRSLSAVDLRSRSWDETAGYIPWYSQPVPDRDRVLRRIAPVRDGVEHIVYHALKDRWEESFIEHTETGLVLINRPGGDDESRFHLDRDGNLLFELPAKDSDFRRLPLEFFREYDRGERAMLRLLRDAEELGVYSQTIPERIPMILFDYAEVRKEEMLNDPGDETFTTWMYANREYYASIDEFLYGTSEMILVNRYEELIALEIDNEENVAMLLNLRDALIHTFSGLREQYLLLTQQHAFLMEEITSSFCIMGPAFSDRNAAIIPQSSALLANSLLTERSITPAQTRHSIFWTVFASIIILACIHAMRPLVLLLTGSAASLACAAVFSAGFIFSAYWIDPLIPMAGSLAGTLVLFITRFAIGYGRQMRFRYAYAPLVSKDMFKQLVKTGHPSLSQTICADAVVIAVKNHRRSAREDKEQPLEAAHSAAEFRRTFSRLVRQAGSVLLGFEGDTALACFGSPLEQGAEDLNRLSKAGELVKKIMDELPDYCLGIAGGQCAFSWSEETGYTAHGRPVVRARIFASLTRQYKVKGIIGASAGKAAWIKGKKISTLSGESFYSLQLKKAAD